ncbi:MAG TPA: polymer-forming cytoskeletal protein [Allosphingosinicella sp.]|nr:polymer-forming cytoskeletal protein [Allosphingosinicella sp.]
MFSKSTTAPAPRPKPARTGTPGLSFIAPETIISGDLATEGQVHVDGRIDGDVKCGQLIQGNDGVIAGSIHAEDARLAGTVEGTVSARTLIVEASARILGDVAYETISIEAGAQIEGRLARRASLGLDEQPRIGAPVSFSPARRDDDSAGAGERLFPISDSAKTAAE